MKKVSWFFLAVILIALSSASCADKKTADEKGQVKNSAGTEELLKVANDIITEVIVKPDTLGDPWEVEKVKGFEGKTMFGSLLQEIKAGKVKVYSAVTGDQLKDKEITDILDGFGSDVNKIAKIQFVEDWYLDQKTGLIVKKTKSLVLGYEVIREQGLPPSYRAMFSIKTE